MNLALKTELLGAAMSETMRVIMWSSAGIVAVLVIGVIVFHVVRRWAFRRMEDEYGPGFNMDQLERMRREGSISEQEFRTLRAGLLGLPAPTEETQETSSSGVMDGDDGVEGREDGPCPPKGD
ncbi:MAG: hypothetical protein ACLFV7_12080 [Phycisphaerae bacterium]